MSRFRPPYAPTLASILDVGAPAEFATTADGRAVVFDGLQPGGYPLARQLDLDALSFASALTPRDSAFGARADGVSDDAPALNAFFAACLSQGQRGYIPPGLYRCASPLVLDYAANRTYAPDILGGGKNATRFKFDPGVSSPNFLATDTTPNDGANGANAIFYPRFGNFALDGSVPGGTVMQIGNRDFSTAFNGLVLDDMVINNDSATDGATGLELNGCYAAQNRGVITVNCAGSSTWGGTTDHGQTTAVRVRRTEFSNLTFAGGNAYTLLHLADDYVFANVFGAQDMEVGNEFIRSDSNAANNTVLGGTIALVETPFNCTGENSNLHVHVGIMGGDGGIFANPNAPLGDPSWGGRGVHLHNPETIWVPTPSVPAVNTWVQNRTGEPMQVYLSVPAGTTVFKRLWYDYTSPGLTIAIGQANTYCKLNPGDQLMWQGNYPPNWAMVPEY